MRARGGALAIVLVLGACSDLSNLAGGAESDGGEGDGGAEAEAGAGDAGPEAAGQDGALEDGPNEDASPDGGTPTGCAPDAGAKPIYLAAGEASPDAIMVDDTTVYWTTGAGNVSGQKIRACGKNGCNTVPTTLTSLGNTGQGQMVQLNLHQDTTDIWWGDGYTPGNVWRCAKTGCTKPLALIGSLSGPYDMVVDATDAFWTESVGGKVRTCSKSSCMAPGTLVSGSPGNWIAADATTLYWVTFGGPAMIQSCAKAGCQGTPTTLVTGLSNPHAIAVGTTNVYWLSSTSGGTTALSVCAKSGCGLTATTVIGLTSASDLAVDSADAAYVVGSDNSGGFVKRCKVGDNPPCIDLTHNENAPASIAIDAPVNGCAAAIYWTNSGDGSIRKLALP